MKTLGFLDEEAELRRLATSFSVERAAAKAGVEVPETVVNPRTGKPSTLVEGLGEIPVHVRVHHWVPGRRYSPSLAYARPLAPLAASLAKLHSLEVPPDFPEPAGGALRNIPDGEWEEIIAAAEASKKDWAAPLKGCLGVLSEVGSLIKTGQGLPALSLGHGDLHQKNVIHAPEGKLVIIDWESAGKVKREQEVVNTILSWAGPAKGSRRKRLAAGFITAYEEAGGIRNPSWPGDAASWLSGRAAWIRDNAQKSLSGDFLDPAEDERCSNIIQAESLILPGLLKYLAEWEKILA